jgi:hypothetical protein
MNQFQPNQPPSDPGVAPGASRRPPLAHPLGDGHGGFNRPRVKMLATEGDVTPAGATYTPPTPAPLPERGAGIHLFLSVLAALAAIIFLVLLLQKL